MFSQLSERRMHVVRWVLTIAWLAMIASLFYDPWTPELTTPNHPWSPLRLTDSCISVQGKCLVEQPYPLATTLFWGAIVPGGIFILLVFGHEIWRRICPLSFLSQIPRALGWQRQFKRENATTGKVRYELAKVRAESWLGVNYPYLQFGWLFIGLCGRILFFNADRIILALWLLFTIGAAITVGYLYGGKSWCNYFCPMAPVQRIYSEPGGLLGSQAHTSEQSITQSMCRTILPDGSEQSACVACQKPCIDIDSERSYWDGLNKPEATFLRYSYIGLVIGYFSYYYLYAGSWDYYVSGAWARQPDQLASLLSPGFYLFGQTINIPKLVAVPLTLGVSTLIGHQLGKWIENRVKVYSRDSLPETLREQELKLTPDLTRHRIFTLSTFIIFNFFFIFGGRPLVQLMPIALQFIYELSLVLLSTLWVYKTWHRSFDLYSRENLVSRFRKQLEKLELNIAQFIEGRTLSDLNTHEVYILAKVLPGFTREKRHTAYKGVVREALEEGYANYSSSLEILQQLRNELGITADEHREVLEELGIEDPELLNPDLKRSLENQIRLTGYRKSLERLMLLQKHKDSSNINSEIDRDSVEIRALRRQYSIAPQEEAWILGGIAPEAGNLRRAEFLLAQLPDLISAYRALHQPILQEHQTVLMLLWNSISHKKELMVRTILEIIEPIQTDPAAIAIATDLGRLAPSILLEILESDSWQNRLHPETLERLNPLEGQSIPYSLDYPISEILKYLDLLLDDRNPLIQTACLHIIAQLNLEQSQSLAHNYTNNPNSPLLQATAKIIQSATNNCPPLTSFPLLEKVVHLFNSDFFHRLNSEILIALADRSEVRTFTTNGVITEAGDTCRELLLLIEGDANIHFCLENKEVQIEKIHPGQTLDELEILANSESKNTIIADSNITRILAVPVAAFDDLLDRDPDFARRVLELESRHLQKFMRSIQPI
jgi:CRP-like cAMP-binding protein